MGKTITIIVPSYNMESCLSKCLSSLVLVDRPERVEVLVINDGSKDGTLDVARSFEQEYPQVFRVIDKQNGNYGSCINVGLKNTTGKYVKILDADDYFVNANFQQMVDSLDEITVDLLISDVSVSRYGKSELHTSSMQSGKILPFDSVCKHHGELSWWMHAITYRFEIFKDMDYKQTEGISYTDEEWSFVPKSNVRSVYYLNHPVYQYIIGREGQTVEPKIWHDNFWQVSKVADANLVALSNLDDTIPRNIRDVMGIRLYSRLKQVYKQYLIYSPDLDRTCLDALDTKMKQMNISLYKKTNNMMLSTPLFPFRFIKIWRKNHNSHFLRIIADSYCRYKKTKE